nr:MAG TPA: putative tail component [Caudoviricetes sp.]
MQSGRGGNAMQIRLEDHSDEVLEALESACQRALEKCGMVAEGYAKKLVNSPGKFGTGALRNSITHTVTNSGERAAYVGTNSEYGVYVECGTGIYYPGGRQTPWVYQDAKGNWHLTHGQRAKPFIKPAVAEHGEQYKKIIEAELKGK